MATGNNDWSDVTWSPEGVPDGNGVSVQLNNTAAGTLVMNKSVTLGRMLFAPAELTTLSSSDGSSITWNNNGGQGDTNWAELGRSRGGLAPLNHTAGRAFTVGGTFMLESNLRVTNWVENRSFNYNASTSGDGKLHLNTLVWAAANTTAMALGGTATHLGGTLISVAVQGNNLESPTVGGTLNLTIGNDNAFGPGDLEFMGTVNINLGTFNHTVHDAFYGSTNLGVAGQWFATDLNQAFFGTDTGAFSGTGYIVTTIPEPGTMGLGLLGSALLLRRKRA
jgi:hypothetical protein